MINVHFQHGVFLPDHGLWLDPHFPQDFAFVSHAHFDHMGDHHRIIASRQTCDLMRSRKSTTGSTLVPLEFGEPHALNSDTQITLHPAGHILGSAQLFLEGPQGSLLYTGDFKLRQGLFAEPVDMRPAQTLIMETTFGRPQYRFPPSDAVMERVVKFCREALDEGCLPVLLGYSLGKSQEILARLSGAGLIPVLHSSVAQITRVCESLGVKFPAWEPFDPDNLTGKVFIAPPAVNRSRMLKKISNRRVAMLSGWAMDRNAVYRYQVDEVFPLSDHADYDDLLRAVELVQPERVLTLHGFAAEFARDLRERGYDAWSLTQSEQLELSLGLSADEPPPPPAAQQPTDSAAVAPSEFTDFAETCVAVSETASKLRKIEILADYLKKLTPQQLPLAATWLSGRPFPQATAKVLHTGWAVIRGALKAVSGQSEPEIRRISRREADTGRTARLILEGRTEPAPFSLIAAELAFQQLRDARGPIAKQAVLQSILQRLAPVEAEFFIRIITGELRIGLKEGLLEDAVAAAFGRPVRRVQEANMLLGDIGQTAVLAREDRLDSAEIRIFRPIAAMLAGSANTAEELWERASKRQNTSEPQVLVQDKFDGIRAQLHRLGDRVEIFSRDLRPITNQFAEIAEAALQLPADVVLDGEMIAALAPSNDPDSPRDLSFFDLQKRLGRDEPDLFLQQDIPLQYVVFDVLWHNGESLLKRPLSERLARLAALKLPEKIVQVALKPVTSPGALEAEFVAARARNNEGLMMKDPTSPYTPGRRGYAWMKFKKEFATLDCVVVAAEQGHGRRSHVLSDYTFAVRDAENANALRTIGKAYSGLTDAEIEELTAHFRKTTIQQHGNYHVVKPDTVLEIAFDSIQPSNRHDSGLALRFPRIKNWRHDKRLKDIDTLQHARELAGITAQTAES